jgi:hypothetical protein
MHCNSSKPRLNIEDKTNGALQKQFGSQTERYERDTSIMYCTAVWRRAAGVRETENGRVVGNGCREEVDEGCAVCFHKELNFKDGQKKYESEYFIQQFLCSVRLNSSLGPTAQHSTAQHSTAQHSTAQHSTAQPRATGCRTIRSHNPRSKQRILQNFFIIVSKSNCRAQILRNILVGNQLHTQFK